MMKTQRLSFLTFATLLFAFAMPALAANPPAPAPPKAEPAGKISALLPVAHIARGFGKNITRTDAKKDDQVIWNDKITTERGGRARITLADQSILSLGSQAELTIVKHDARNQQTALQLGYGRVRAEVSKITRQGGGFELRTPTAVAGVIGTDFGTDASTVGSTTFLCISGLVQVSNSDPNIAGSVQCAPGLTTTVTAGKAPTPPQNATPEQIQQMIQDTEPAIISAMAPMTALPGATVDATINGSKLAGVKSVNVSGDGIAISLAGTPSDSAVTIHMVIAANAAPGPRTIHLVKSSGADSAAVFTIMAPPTTAGGDYKKGYLDLLTQVGSTSAGGLSAYLAQLQQTAGQAIQQLQQQNAANLNLNDASTAFNSQVSVVQNEINNAVTQINTAVTQAGTSFTAQYDSAYKSLLERHPDGAADDQFNTAIKTSYDSIASTLGNTIKAITGNLISVVAAANTNIAQTQQTFLQQLTAASNPPIPAVNFTERNIDLGAALGQGGIPALDASNSKASGGASIISYKWVLCDPSYKPAQIGVPLAGNATAGCNALQGYASSSSDFQFPTCNLAGNDYVARVTITDSNNQSAAMDVKLHILAPTYDDPTTMVRSLAQAYTTLQSNTFLAYFDQTGFAGYTALSENVRNTFPLLASMQINPRVSQSAITCNDATVRADWVQNYTYKANANIAFSQTEQLSMRMLRTPGKGWFITDFQGDNGTVQGQLPGPVVTDSPQPDLIALGVYPSYVGKTSTNPPVPPGAQNFTAVIQNVGGADFTGSTAVRFQLLDSTNTPLGVTLDAPLPTPLAAGQTVNVSATLTVPSTIPVGTQFHVLANVNPTCLPEAHCDASNQADEVLLLGTPIQLTQVTTPALQVGGPAVPLTINVSGAAPVTLTLPTGITTASPLTQTTTAAGTVTWNLVAGFTAASGTNQTITVSANAGIPISLAATYSVTAPVFSQATTPTLNSGGAAQPLTVSVNVPGTYTLVLPSGIATSSANPQTITAAGNLTWNLTSAFTSATGTNLTANVTSGIYSFAAKYNNNGQANYVITSLALANRTAPFTGANSLQVGENTSLIAVVKNVGNTSPTGTITVTATCAPLNLADTTSCTGGGNPTGTTSAPSAGASVAVTLPTGNNNGMLPGHFNATATLTTAIAQSSTADDSITVPFDTADFVVTVQNALSPQNIIPSSSQTFTVAVQVVGTTPFAVPVTVISSPTYAGISYTPSSSNVSGTQLFTVNAGATTPVGGFAASITGTNRGVSRPAAQGFVVMNPQIVYTNLFVNDSSNPLEIQLNGSGQTIGMQLSGASFSGLAKISLPTVTGFSLNTDAGAGVAANGTFNVTVQATSPISTIVPITVSAQLPNTNPPLSITKTVFVKTVGLPDLKLINVTAPSLSAPWIDGQGIDYPVTVMNNGTIASAGGESVHVELNGVTVGATTVGALAPGASQQVTIHLVAPDIHGSSSFSGSGTFKVKVDPDQIGDTDYTNNSATVSVSLANWHIGLNQSSPVQVITSAGGGNAIVYFTGAVDGSTINNYATLNFTPTQGQTSSTFTLSNFGQPGDAACGVSTPANTMFCGTVATTSGTLQPGLYFAQLIVTLSDSASGKSTQRQATVPVQVNSGSNNTTATLASSANNCSGTACTTTGSTLQINGGLATQYSVTMSMTCTTVGVAGPVTAPCSGTADLAIHDAVNTETTAISSVKAVPTGSPVVLRVAAAFDPNGNIQTGSASGYAIGINGVQHSVVRQGTASITPDPVGTQVPFTINVGDLGVTANTGANSCTGVVANGSPLQLTVTWNPTGGFNASTLSWEWQNANHALVGGSPLNFSTASGQTSGSGNYSPVTFTLSNTTPQDGVQAYFLAVTISNGTATATKYFPFYFDLSLGQNFCGAVSAARGYNVVQGSWLRSAAGFGGPTASSAQLRTEVAAGSPDIHISAGDVSFTPSIPKVGEPVLVRFKASNTGDADAAGMPIALQVNGVTVASDTFDVAKGHSALGGLTWTPTADLLRTGSAAGSGARSRQNSKLVDLDGNSPQDSGLTVGGPVQLQAAIVVDPLHTKQQKTANDKTAALTHFSIRGSGPSSGAGTAVASSQRMLVELEDGACLGLRLSSGSVMPCGSADLEVTIGDLGKSLLSLDTLSGVGDIGAEFMAARRPDTSSVRFGAQASGMAGHTYAVQLPNGKTAVVNVESIRNPAEMDAKARALFRASAARVLRGMGDSSGAQETGDLTGGGSHPTVFIVLNVQGI